MALEVGSIVARLGARLDDDAFDRFDRRLEGARRSARRDVEAELRGDFDPRGFDRFDDAVDRAERGSGRIRGAMRTLGPAMGTAAAVGGGAAALLGKRFIDSASNIAESSSKLSTVLGKDAETVQRFAETSATAIGQSREQALEAAGGFAAFLKNLGQTSDQAARSSVDLTRLASDLASFNNTSPEEAVVALSSALRGEAEPIRRYGVLLDDASLRAEALRQGLVKNTKEALEPQTRALAAQSLIFRQTKTAQGDFERTSNGLANQQRILKARLSDVGAELGTRLLPFALKVVSGLNRMVEQARNGKGPLDRLRDAGAAVAGAFRTVVDRVRDVTGWLGRNRTALETATAAVLAGVAAWKAMSIISGVVTAYRAAGSAAGIFAAAQTRLNLALKANPIGIVITVLAALAAALVVAYKRSDDFRKTVDGAFQAVKSAARDVIGFVIDRFDDWLAVMGTVVGTMGKLPGPLGAPFRAAKRSIDDARGTLARFKKGLDDVPSRKNVRVNVRYSVTRADGRNAGDSKDDLPGGGGQGDGVAAMREAYDAVVTDATQEGQRKATTLAERLKRTAAASFDTGDLGAGGGGVGVLDGKPVASWIIPILLAARKRGWTGRVSSGFRSFAEQTRLWNNRHSNPYPVAPPGSSNHEGSAYPRGAVDVSNWQQLAAMIRGGLGGGRLKHYGAGDVIHFSGTGRRRGGKVGPNSGGPRAFLRTGIGGLLDAFIAGEGTKDEWVISQEGDRSANIGYARQALEHLTGRRVALHRYGKGIRDARSFRDKGEAGIRASRAKIDDLEAEYRREERRFNITDEELVTEDADGNPIVDAKAVDARGDELGTLYRRRRTILNTTKTLRDRIARLRDVLDVLHYRLRKAGNAAKKGSERRKRYHDQAERAKSRRGALGADLKAAEGSILDLGIDLDELKAEEASVRGTRVADRPADTDAPPPADDGPGFVPGADREPPAAPATPDEPATPAEPAPAAPDPAEVAALALAAVGAFQAARGDLFAQMGGNVGGTGYGAPNGTRDAAGFRYFGADASGAGFDGGASPIGAAGGGGTIGGSPTIINHFAAPPPDPHTWVAGVAYEVKTL